MDAIVIIMQRNVKWKYLKEQLMVLQFFACLLRVLATVE